MFKYSATQWIYGNEDIEVSVKRLKRYGYDGIELAGEPDSMNVEAIKQLLQSYEMECTSICGIYKPERDLSSSNEETRTFAIQYVKNCIDMAADLGANVVIVVPTPVGKMAPETTSQEEWSNAVVSLREAGQYAEAKGVFLAVEALNRFETYLINKLELAKEFVEEVNQNNVRLMADLFHMNIEERNNVQTLNNIAPYLVHVHIADNTREAAGLGNTNFQEVISALIKMNYKGAITMEFLPPVSNPYSVVSENKDTSVHDFYTEQSINYIKGIVHSFSHS